MLFLRLRYSGSLVDPLEQCHIQAYGTNLNRQQSKTEVPKMQMIHNPTQQQQSTLQLIIEEVETRIPT